jgi:hypothetical protein
MFGREKNLIRLQEVEHLKGYVNLVIDAFHEGSGLEGAPITLEMAKLLIWREVQRVWSASDESTLGGCVWARVACSKPSGIVSFTEKLRSDIVSVRCLGARKENDDTVAYVWFQSGDLKKFFAMAAECDCRIRDWEFYD